MSRPMKSSMSGSGDDLRERIRRGVGCMHDQLMVVGVYRGFDGQSRDRARRLRELLSDDATIILDCTPATRVSVPPDGDAEVAASGSPGAVAHGPDVLIDACLVPRRDARELARSWGIPLVRALQPQRDWAGAAR